MFCKAMSRLILLAYPGLLLTLPPILCSVAVPSVGLSDELLINLGNFLESEHPKVTLFALSTSVAGSCYSGNAAVDHCTPLEQPSGSPRCTMPCLSQHNLPIVDI